MHKWSWMIVLSMLAVLLVGCGPPSDGAGQSERAAEDGPTTVAEKPISTDTPPATDHVPASTSTLSPTTAQPTPTSTPPPAAGEPVPTSTSPPTETSTVAPPTQAPTPTPLVVLSGEDVQRITPAEAKELVDGDLAVLYDARSAAAYRSVHAAGALSFPEADMATRYGGLPSDKSLIFY